MYLPEKENELFFYNNHKFLYKYSSIIVDDDDYEREIGFIHSYRCEICDVPSDIHELYGNFESYVFKPFTCEEWKLKMLLR